MCLTNDGQDGMECNWLEKIGLTFFKFIHGVSETSLKLNMDNYAFERIS